MPPPPQQALRKLNPGEILFMEGDAGNEAYFVRSGELAVLRREGPRMTKLATLPTGAVIGEMALLDDAPRSATVRAESYAELVVLDRRIFEAAFESLPQGLTAVIRVVVHRLRQTLATKYRNDLVGALPLLLTVLLEQAGDGKNSAKSAVQVDAAEDDATQPLDALYRPLLSLYGAHTGDVLRLMRALATQGWIELPRVGRILQWRLVEREPLEQLLETLRADSAGQPTFADQMEGKRAEAVEFLIRMAEGQGRFDGIWRELDRGILRRLEQDFPQEMGTVFEEKFLDLLEKNGIVMIVAGQAKTDRCAALRVRTPMAGALQRHAKRLHFFRHELPELIAKG
jgi:CRP-like cAMP-binding protein